MFFTREKILDLTSRVMELEGQIKRLKNEWDDTYDKLSRLVERNRKRLKVDEKEQTTEQPSMESWEQEARARGLLGPRTM